MAKEYRTMKNNIELPYKWSLGSSWTRFFDGLKEENIWGAKCSKCKKTFVPGRKSCPLCFSEMNEWAEVGSEGTLKSWTLATYKYDGQIKEPPYIMALIKLNGADNNFSHFIGGFDFSNSENVRKKLKVGMKVKAVWNDVKNSNINDIKYFEPL